MQFDVLTIFPRFFESVFTHGVLHRALKTGLVRAETHDLRGFTYDRHRTVDDRPFGGGEGMLLKAQPILEAAAAIGVTPRLARDPAKEVVLLLSASGKPFTQAWARKLASVERVVLICGRYEGVDERVSELLCDDEVSIGDYVLSGGELGAAIVIDATVRLLPGALGHADSNRYESFGEHDAASSADTVDSVPRSTHGAGGLLDYPQYTRPAELHGVGVPDVLSGGDHLQIRRWRREAALAKTLRNRPDLLAQADLSASDREYLAHLGWIGRSAHD